MEPNTNFPNEQQNGIQINNVKNEKKESYKLNNIIEFSYFIFFLIFFFFGIANNFGTYTVVTIIYAGIAEISFANRIRKFTKNKNTVIRYLGLIGGILGAIVIFLILTILILLVSTPVRVN